MSKNITKNHSIDEALAYCLELIQRKGAEKNYCLSLYPHFKSELEPLIEKYLLIRAYSDIHPRADFSKDLHHRLMNLNSQISAVTNVEENRNYIYKPERKLNWRFKMLQIIIITLLAMGAVTGGAVYASDSAEPGDFLYNLDRAVEELQLNLTRNEGEAAKLRLMYSIERIEEARNRLGEEDLENAEIALDSYGNEISAIAQTVGGPGGADDEALLELINAALSIHQDVLTGLLDVVPEQAQDAILNALEKSNISFESLPGSPEDKGKPEDVGEGENSGPPENSNVPDSAGPPENAGQPENNPGQMINACMENIPADDLDTLQQLAADRGMDLEGLMRMFCASGSLKNMIPMLPDAATHRSEGGPPQGAPAGGRP